VFSFLWNISLKLHFFSHWFNMFHLDASPSCLKVIFSLGFVVKLNHVYCDSWWWCNIPKYIYWVNTCVSFCDATFRSSWIIFGRSLMVNWQVRENLQENWISVKEDQQCRGCYLLSQDLSIGRYPSQLIYIYKYWV
jgi:hypothetical protein